MHIKCGGVKKINDCGRERTLKKVFLPLEGTITCRDQVHKKIATPISFQQYNIITVYTQCHVYTI